MLRARSKITSPFHISSSGHLEAEKSVKNLKVFQYSCAFWQFLQLQSNLNLSVKTGNLAKRPEVIFERALRSSAFMPSAPLPLCVKIDFVIAFTFQSVFKKTSVFASFSFYHGKNTSFLPANSLNLNSAVEHGWRVPMLAFAWLIQKRRPTHRCVEASG